MVEGTKLGLRIFFFSADLWFELLCGGFLEIEVEEEEMLLPVSLTSEAPQPQRLLHVSEEEITSLFEQRCVQKVFFLNGFKNFVLKFCFEILF